MTPIELPAVIAQGAAPEGQCAWFLLCENDATTTRNHSVLGDVPICDRCDKKVEALST